MTSDITMEAEKRNEEQQEQPVGEEEIELTWDSPITIEQKGDESSGFEWTGWFLGMLKGDLLSPNTTTGAGEGRSTGKRDSVEDDVKEEGGLEEGRQSPQDLEVADQEQEARVAEYSFSDETPSSPQQHSSEETTPPLHPPLTPSRLTEETKRLKEYLDTQGKSKKKRNTDRIPQFLPEWRQTDLSAEPSRVPGTYNWLELVSDGEETATATITSSQSSATIKLSAPRGSEEDLISFSSSPPEPSTPTPSVLLLRGTGHRQQVMAPYTERRPLITFADKKGEMIEELFEAIETEEEMRIESLDVTSLGQEKYDKALARGPLLQKMRLRQSLEGSALDYYLTSLSPEVRMDYEKSKKTLLRRYGSQANVDKTKRDEDAKWAAISRMTALTQGRMTIKEYVLELEALADALDESMHDRLIDNWLKGFKDEKDGRTLRIAAKQADATTPSALAKSAREYFVTDTSVPSWTPGIVTEEIPAFAVHPTASQNQVAGMQNPELFDLLRQVAVGMQSMQLSLTGSGNQQRQMYQRPAHHRAQSDSQVAFQQQPQTTVETSDSQPMLCYNCRAQGHKAMHCPLYNPRRDGPTPPAQPLPTTFAQQQPFPNAGLPAYQARRDQSAPPQQREVPLSAANAVEISTPRITLEEPVPNVHVERTHLVPQEHSVLNVAVVDAVSDLEGSPYSSSTIAAALAQEIAMADSNKRARVEEFYDPARDTHVPKHPQLKVPQITKDHYDNLMKDAEFRETFLQEAVEQLRADFAKEQATKRKARRTTEIPKIKALTEEESRFSGLRLLKRIPFMIAHPGLEQALFTLADLLDVSPRLRQQVTDAMKSSEVKKRGRHAAQDEQMEDVTVVADFLAALVDSASEIYASDTEDLWLEEEDTVTLKTLFYTFGTLQVGGVQSSVWVSLGGMLIDGGALLNLITLTVVMAAGAHSELSPVTNMSYKTAAGSIHRINWKWRTVIKIAGCRARITFFVTDSDAPYSLLLSRRFMQQARMKADYAMDTYTMGDTRGNRVKVPRHTPSLARPLDAKDVPVLVNVSEPGLTVVGSMGPPLQDVDVMQVSAAQTRLMVLEATRAILARIHSKEPLLVEDGEEEVEEVLMVQPAGKVSFQA